MEHAIPSQHPTLELGPLQIPGLVLPIALFLLPLIVGPRTLRRFLSSPAFGNGLTFIHLLLCIRAIHGVLYKEETADNIDNTLPLLSYITMILGEAAFLRSNFWVYTPVTVGWLLPILPSRSFHRVLEPQSTRAMISLMLSLPGVLLRESDIVSTGVTLSACSLFTRMTFLVWTGSIGGHGASATTGAVILVPILGGGCFEAVAQIAYGKPWFNRLCRATEDWVPQQFLRCCQGAIAAQALLNAGCILNGFLWSCFRWRWLCNGKASRSPAWTNFSIFSGFFFFVPVFLSRWWLRRWWLELWEPIGDMDLLVQRFSIDCLAATWWTTCVYLVLWLMLETTVVRS